MMTRDEHGPVASPGSQLGPHTPVCGRGHLAGGPLASPSVGLMGAPLLQSHGRRGGQLDTGRHRLTPGGAQVFPAPEVLPAHLALLHRDPQPGRDPDVADKLCSRTR